MCFSLLFVIRRVCFSLLYRRSCFTVSDLFLCLNYAGQSFAHQLPLVSRPGPGQELATGLE